MSIIITIHNQRYHLSHNILQRRDNCCCCTTNVLHETLVLEPQTVDIYTLGGGGMEKVLFTSKLLKMLTFFG